MIFAEDQKEYVKRSTEQKKAKQRDIMDEDYLPDILTGYRSGGGSGSKKEEEHKMLVNFVDLLERCLVLDPGRRITPKEALGHSFIRG